MLRRPGPVIGAIFLSGSFGCGEPRLVGGFADSATLIRVTPDVFTGSVECARGVEGALQTYTVQLQRLGPGGQIIDGGLENDVQVSPPAPCDRAVVFPAIAGQPYAATISGFDRVPTPDELAALEPRWTASCGFGSGALDAGVDPLAPTVALQSTTVPLRGCTQFDAPGSATAQLDIDVATALGPLRCGTEPGSVAYVEARLGSTLRRAACGAPLRLPVATATSRFVTVTLTGYEALPGAMEPEDSGVVEVDAAADASALDAGPSDAGFTPPPADAGRLDAGIPLEGSGVPRWATECVGRVLPAATSSAVCEPFASLAP